MSGGGRGRMRLKGAHSGAGGGAPPVAADSFQQYDAGGLGFQAVVPQGKYLTDFYWGEGGAATPVRIVSTWPPYLANQSGNTVNDPGTYTGRDMNGLSVNPGNRAQNPAGTVEGNFWGVGQGYDSYVEDNLVYVPGLNVDPLRTGQVLVVEEGSVVKAVSSNPVEESARPALSDAILFTVVRTAPLYSDQFRPPPALADKQSIVLREVDIDYSFLVSVPVPSGSYCPDLAAVMAETSRMWQTLSCNNLQSRSINPARNQSEYGQTIGYDIGDILAILVHDTYTLAQKKPLLWNALQIGLDIIGRVEEGGIYSGIGGGQSWAKPLVVLCAAAFRNTPYATRFANVASTMTTPRVFGEDSMLFYVTPDFVDTPRTQSATRPREPFLPYMVDVAEWSNDWEVQESAGSQFELAYRPIVGPTQVGFALYLQMMGILNYWGSDLFRLYCARYFNWARKNATGQVNLVRPNVYADWVAYWGTSGFSDMTWLSAKGDGEWVWLKNASYLDLHTVPATSAVEVIVNGTPRPVTEVRVYGPHLVARLATPLAFGETGTARYLKPFSIGMVTSLAYVEAASSAALTINNATGVLPPAVGTIEAIDNGVGGYITNRSTGLNSAFQSGTAQWVMMAVKVNIQALAVNAQIAANQTGGTFKWYLNTPTSLRCSVLAPSVCQFRPSRVITTGEQVHVFLVDFTKLAASDGMLYGIDGQIVSQASPVFNSLAGLRTFEMDALFSGGMGLLNSSLGGGVPLDGAISWLWLDWGNGPYTGPTFDAALVAAFSGALGGNGQTPTGSVPKGFWAGTQAEWKAPGGMINRGKGGYRKLYTRGAFN